MGLDISHDAWHGAYSAFMWWRTKLAEIAGLPPLELMEGFYSEDVFSMNPIIRLEAFSIGNETVKSIIAELKKSLPIRWSVLRSDVLYELLYHSDSDGEISWQIAGKLAKRLRELLPLLPDEDAGGHIGNWREKTEQFIKGCEEAYKKKEKLEFG